MTVLNLVTIHHEGAGDPTDVARGAKGGYTYWLGKTGWTRLRSPYDSYATLHYNHVSVDICLSGDRDNWEVTNDDLTRLSQIAADARARGELSNHPTVRPHRWTYNTACPGSRSMNRWDDIAARFVGTAPPAPKPVPVPGAKWHPTLQAGAYGSSVTDLQWRLDIGIGGHLTVDGVFGHVTQSAVFGFQAFFKLTVDGIVGPRTWSMVDYCYALKGGR